MIRRGVEMSELARWAVCGLVVVFAHASAAAIVANWPDPIASSEPAGAITIDLAPLVTSTADARDDVAPGPRMVKVETPPDQKIDEKVEEKPVEQTVTEVKPVEEEKIEPKPIDEKVEAPPAPPAVKPEVTAAVPEPRPVQHQKPKPARPPAPATTAPQRAPHLAALTAAPSQGQISASSNAMPSWKGQVFAQITRNVHYPAEAEARGERGVPLVTFRVDRHGRLLSARVTSASGYVSLDQEAVAIVKRAQPFPPPPPAEVVGGYIQVDVPIRFKR